MQICEYSIVHKCLYAIKISIKHFQVDEKKKFVKRRSDAWYTYRVIIHFFFLGTYKRIHNHQTKKKW